VEAGPSAFCPGQVGGQHAAVGARAADLVQINAALAREAAGQRRGAQQCCFAGGAHFRRGGSGDGRGDFGHGLRRIRRRTRSGNRLTRLQNPANNLADRHGHADHTVYALDNPVGGRVDLHRRLVGLDLEHDLALGDGVAVLDIPVRDLAFAHVHVDARQYQFHRHAQALTSSERRAAATMSGTWGTAAFSSSGL
jgi:hypothetical protein